MPHATFKLIPGVDTRKTPALNEAAISESNLIRFVPDRSGLGLVQKLGGWSKFFDGNIGSIPRCLWAWSDANADNYLGVGAEASLSVIEGGSRADVTPEQDSESVTLGPFRNRTVTGASGNGTTATITFKPPITIEVGATIVVSGINPAGYNGTVVVTASSSGSVSYANATVAAYVSGGTIAPTNSEYGVSMTINSDLITIRDPGSNITSYDAVWVKTPVAIDSNYILFGQYPCIQGTSGAYQVQAKDVLGNPIFASFTINAGGRVGTATAGGASTITLDAGASAVDSFYNGCEIQIIDGTGVGQLRFISSYVGATKVATVNSAWTVNPNATSVFRTCAGSLPYFAFTTGSGTISVTLWNHGYVVGDVFPIIDPMRVGNVTLQGNYTVVAVANANTFTIIASEQFSSKTVTNASGDGTYATLTFGSSFKCPARSTITISGMNPAGYNGTYTVLSSTDTTVTYANTTVAAFVSGGSVFVDNARQNENEMSLQYYFGSGPISVSGGYGAGTYGSGGYGTGSSVSTRVGTPITTSDWTMDNWGGILVACPLDGAIYTWNKQSADFNAVVIPQAPPISAGMFVAMPQRQIVAWGTTNNGIQDPMLIRWCEVSNYNQWQANIGNQAGSYRIPRGSKIVRCMQGPQQAIVWTDIGVWSMQYVGPPFIYSFNEIGVGCGLIGRKASATAAGIVFWMGRTQFYRLDANGVSPIDCPIWDVIFQAGGDCLCTTEPDKIRAAANSQFGEIMWFYPTESSGGEVSRYVKYNFLVDQWDYGILDRTAWINESVLGPPIGGAPNGFIYQHETSPDADGQPMLSSFQTGYFVMTDADVKMFVDQIWPDMKWNYYGESGSAEVFITFYVTDYPGQTPLQYGPYLMTESTKYITPRFRGRLVSIKISSQDLGSFWRIGAIRYRLQQDGKF